MAHKKKKKANRPKPAASPAAADNIQDVDVETEAVEEQPVSKPRKEANSSGKGKEKAVVKSQARAKDPKKAAKKPSIFRRFIEYLKQVRLEIKRTTWPTRSEVLNMTIIVIVALLFFGILIFIIDFVMVQLLNLYGSLAPDPSAAVDAGSIDASALDASAVDSGTGIDGGE